MDSDEEEKKESSSHKQNGKNGVHREPLEGKEKKSKDLVAKSKLANKRQQKEALKKIKQKRSKGTIREGGPTSE